MNYLPFCGYWFYGAQSGTQRAAYFCSWGLLAVAPIVGFVLSCFTMYYERLRR